MKMDESIEETDKSKSIIKSWESYKILNKIKESVQQKRRISRDVAAQQSMDNHGNQITIEKQLSMSKEQLNDLLHDGRELITNIRLANERRETNRHQKEDQQRACLLTNLQHESKEAKNKLNIINKAWTQLTEISDPMELNDRLCYQNGRIEHLMQQKDAMIIELEDAIKTASRIFNSDQMKQQGDIQLLIERVDEQIEVMKSVYLEHLELLHKSIDIERRTFKMHYSNEWQNLYDDQTIECKLNLNDLLDRKEKYYEEIVSTRLKHEEINRKMRIKLDKDNDLVQQRVQRTKAEIELNTEQLNYNLYVLQNRAAENIIVRNKQKKRLIQMRTCIAMLRKKINDVKMTHVVDNDLQAHRVLNLYASIKDLEHKIFIFNENDNRKFQHFLQLHEDNFDSKIKNILTIDKILHEKQLGLRWKPFTYDKSLRKNKLESILSSIYVARNRCIDDLNSMKSLQNQVEEVRSQQNNFFDLFDAISEQISSQMNWMLGEKFTEIIELIDGSEQKCIITIDNIFTALGINDIKNAHLLIKYFLPYSSCIVCLKNYSELKKDEDDFSSGCIKHNHSFTNLFVEQYMIPVIMQQFLIDLNTNIPRKIIKKNNLDEGLLALHSIDFNEIDQFWNDYVGVIPSDLHMIWDTLLNGQLRYLEILKKRKKLIDECSFLRQQNKEIAYLLQQYAIDDLKKFEIN